MYTWACTDFVVVCTHIAEMYNHSSGMQHRAIYSTRGVVSSEKTQGKAECFVRHETIPRVLLDMAGDLISLRAYVVHDSTLPGVFHSHGAVARK